MQNNCKLIAIIYPVSITFHIILSQNQLNTKNLKHPHNLFYDTGHPIPIPLNPSGRIHIAYDNINTSNRSDYVVFQSCHWNIRTRAIFFLHWNKSETEFTLRQIKLFWWLDEHSNPCKVTTLFLEMSFAVWEI